MSTKRSLWRNGASGPTELDRWLESLSDAVDSGSRERIFQELHRLVPTFREPDEVNEAAIRAVEQGRRSS